MSIWFGCNLYENCYKIRTHLGFVIAVSAYVEHFFVGGGTGKETLLTTKVEASNWQHLHN